MGAGQSIGGERRFPSASKESFYYTVYLYSITEASIRARGRVFLFPAAPEREGEQPYRTRWRMTLEYARRNYPGCVLIESSRELRLIPDTPEEIDGEMHGGL